MCPADPSTAPAVTSENIRNTTRGRESSFARSVLKVLRIDLRGG